MTRQNKQNTAKCSLIPTLEIKSKEDKYGFSFLFIMALLPVISLLAPRALSFLPGLIALIFFMTQRFYLYEKMSLPKTLLLLACGICGLSMLSTLWSIAPDIAVSRSIKTAVTLIPGVFFIYLTQQLPDQTIKKYAALLPIGFLVAAALLSFEYLAGMPLHRAIHHIPFSEIVRLHELNRSACVLAILSIASVLSLRSALPCKQYFALGLFALIMAPIFMITASQSAQLAIICGLIVAIAFPYSRKWGWSALKILIVALIMSAPWLATWLFNNYAESIHALPHMGKGDQSASAGNRLEVWDFISRYALQNPLYGFGVEATRAVEEFDSAEIFQRGKTILHPHNFALQAWMEFGALGAVLISSLLIFTMQKIQNKFQYASQRILLPTFCMIVSIGATGYGVWQGWWLGLILTAAAFSLVCARFCQLQKDEEHTG